MVNTGYFYEKGMGVAIDLEKALYWYEKAANKGDIYGMRNTAIFYLDGKGCNVDKEKGMYWLTKAAEGGHPAALVSLGYKYEQGDLVQQSYQKAYQYSLAYEDDRYDELTQQFPKF